jgi:hypothetical protein
MACAMIKSESLAGHGFDAIIAGPRKVLAAYVGVC